MPRTVRVYVLAVNGTPAGTFASLRRAGAAARAAWRGSQGVARVTVTVFERDGHPSGVAVADYVVRNGRLTRGI